MASRHWSFGLLLACVLVAGASAGIVATVLLNASLDEYAAGLFEGQRPAVPQTGNGAAEEVENAVERVKTVAQASMVLITAPSIDSRLASSWMTVNDAMGYGMVVSTDGWVLVHSDVLADVANPLRGVELWIDGARYTPTQYVADTVTDAVMLKIDANNLPPVAFGASENADSGTQVYALTWEDRMYRAQIVDTEGGEGGLMPAEMYSDGWATDVMLPVGAGVFAANGDAWALAGETTLLPMHHAAAFVREVIRAGVPLHAGFGATVVDITDPLNMDDAMRQGRTEGALVTAVNADGAAAAAGVAVGDVIVAVDDVPVDHITTIAELLRLYDPGQTAKVTVVRAGTETSFTVTLGDFNDLVY